MASQAPGLFLVCSRGFSSDSGRMSFRKLKIEPQFRSCHTAVSSDGYLFEGHIPSRFVRQFLKENNLNAIGLSVPGMPLGSPGMEVEGRFTPYDVLIHFRERERERSTPCAMYS